MNGTGDSGRPAMKCPEILKKPLTQLIFCSGLFCFLPYLVLLFQLENSGDPDAMAARFFFIFASAAVTVLTALLIRKKAVRTSVAVLVWGSLEFLILLDVFMLVFTGHSFDQSFLLHFKINVFNKNVVMAFWKPVSGILLLYIAAAAAVGFLAGKIGQAHFARWKLAALAFFILFFFISGTPCEILVRTLIENSRSAFDRNRTADLSLLQAKPGRNLVFIVVESLEQNYLNEKHFPGLIPNISKWMKSPKALRFENMISSANNTFDFFYQSHMGNYLYSTMDTESAGLQVSLTRILKQAGYNTAILKACDLNFANVGIFAEKIKYDLRMDSLTPEVKKQVTEPGAWGFRDYELFEIAKKEFHELAAKKQPFALTLFTVDSHAPNGVTGKKTLFYTAPDGQHYSLLSALHTTDAALGKFLDWIYNSPAGKDTVTVITGDHLLMGGMVSGNNVQRMLNYKTREKLLSFIINGKKSGTVEHACWPVDLAPIILDQTGVSHNAQFPYGINPLAVNYAAPRIKLDHKTYMQRNKAAAGRVKSPFEQFDFSIKMSGGAQDPVMHFGQIQSRCLPLEQYTGFFKEFHFRTNSPTAWQWYLTRDFARTFETNPDDRNYFYVVCSCGKNLLHFFLGEIPLDKCFLAVVMGGWYKVSCADRLSGLTLTSSDEPIPRIAEGKIDISRNIVTVKKGNWTFPLFSKTDTYLLQCAILASDDAMGQESIRRLSLHDREDMDRLRKMLKDGSRLTLILPPFSPFHGKLQDLQVPEQQLDHILRLQINHKGKSIELFPMRLPHERYIGKSGKGRYFYLKDDAKNEQILLDGAAPLADFGRGLCFSMTFDGASPQKPVFRSFSDSGTAVQLMLQKKPGTETLLICGKNSEFLKKYYPHLAGHNVLFSITGSAVRHAVQYDNGNFRIPAAAEPLNTLGGASVRSADGFIVICWGNASFVLPAAELDSAFAAGKELIIKVPQYNPAEIAVFTMDNDLWRMDILKDIQFTDFLIFGNDKSPIPKMLDQSGRKNYFIAISDGNKWKLSWNDKISLAFPPVDVIRNYYLNSGN
jgi:phosphoglycerol transferase MdoB-like AlkP superfamily enzyme